MRSESTRDPEILRLIDEHPLAWIVSHGASGFGATLLPFLAEQGDDGRIITLLGHFASSNPQVQALRESPRAAILFLGPHAYISPEYVTKPGWAPTWNYASARFEVDIDFQPAANDHALALLVARMERDRREPWTTAKMGARYAQLSQRVVAFRARVHAVNAKFKLGQDETHATLDELLARTPDPPLVSWMRRHNGRR
jgi:transcriptional regulator